MNKVFHPLIISFYLLVLLSACGDKKKNPTETFTKEMMADSIAHHYGADQFHRIDSIDFTFAVNSPRGKSARSWTWMPKTNRVRYSGKDTALTFQRPISQSDTFLRQYDARFVNDKYWLLFPFQIKWDSTTIIYREHSKSPISEEQMPSLKFIYPEKSGYTPGDSYIIYFDSTYTIREWTYCPENNCDRGMSFSWKEQKSFGPFRLTTRFERDNGDFAIQMKDVAIHFE